MIAVLLLAFFTAGAKADLANGAYVARAAGCTDCHTVTADRPFAGGVALSSPFGTFYTPNLTPDNETGLGEWSEDDFTRALRDGVAPDGSLYYPSFPFRSFTKMTDADIHDLYLYFRSLAPIRSKVPRTRLSFPYNQRDLLYFWRLLYFGGGDPVKNGRGAFRSSAEHTSEWNRGAYLTEAVFHCTECHTPRTSLGGLIEGRWLGGGTYALGGKIPPNITPDEDSAVAGWTKSDWLRFLSAGKTPDGHSPSAEMAQVIRGTAGLTPQDRATVVEYLQSLPPVAGGRGGE